MGQPSQQPDLRRHAQALPDPRLAVPTSGSPEVIAAAADDFGHLVHRVPMAVSRPRSAGEVAELVRYAASAGLPIRARGAGHSVSGQAQCEGMVCDLSSLDQVHTSGDELVSAGAGTRWSTLLAATVACGLTPPVLTDYLELSVGGTLAAGGIGGTSFLYGPQADQVAELEVVTATGEIVTCGPSSDAFARALAAQGRGGIITRAAIPLIPAPERARWYKIAVPDVLSMAACQLRIARERQFGYLEGQIALDETGRWTYLVEAAAFYSGSPPADQQMLDGLTSGIGPAEIQDVGYREFCHRMLAGVRLLAATGDWYRPHPWFSVFLPTTAAVPYVTQALAGLTTAAVGPIPALLYPLRRGHVPASGLVTPDGDDDGLFFSFSILRTVASDPALLATALDHNQALADLTRSIGGTVYPISALPDAAATAG